MGAESAIRTCATFDSANSYLRALVEDWDFTASIIALKLMDRMYALSHCVRDEFRAACLLSQGDGKCTYGLERFSRRKVR